MLSKTATMLLGLINSEPLNAYELIKQLQLMNVKNWYEIADSTVYATIKLIENRTVGNSDTLIKKNGTYARMVKLQTQSRNWVME